MHQLNQRVPAPTTSRGLPLRSAPRSQPVLALNSRAWPTSAPLPRRGIGRVTLRWVIRVDGSVQTPEDTAARDIPLAEPAHWCGDTTTVDVDASEVSLPERC